MATVIDALLVTLGIDASSFKKGTKETDEALKKTSAASTKTSKDMESWGKNAAGSLSKLRNEALGLLAVFTAGVGIKSFVESTITSASSLGRLSQNLNMSAKDVAEWQLANKNAGGTVEGMTAQLEAASHAVAAYKNGVADAETTDAFFYGDMHDSDMKSVETYMAAKSRILSKLKDDPVQQSFVAGKIGVSKDTFNLMKQTTEEVARLRGEQSKLADAQAKASIPMEALRKKLDSLKNNFEAVGVKILTSLMPQFDRFANWVNEHQGDIEAWANRAVVAVERFVKWADSAAESVGGWKNVLIGLVAIKVLTIVGPVISLAAAMAQLAVSLGAVGGVAGAGALSVMGRLVALAAKLGVGVALLTHTDELNTGEDEELARRRKMAPTTNGGVKDGSQDSWDDDAPKKRNAPRGIRNNNPGNLNFAGQKGATKEPGPGGRFAVFGTMEEGVAALVNQLKLYAARGIDTIADIVKKYAPAAENDVEAYIKALEKATGKKSNEKLNLNDQATLVPLVDGIIAHENGPSAVNTVNTPNYWKGNPSAGNAANTSNAVNTVNMVNAAQAPARAANNNTSNTSSSETNINGPITINTQATDAKGIARDLGKVIASSSLAAQANTGLA